MDNQNKSISTILDIYMCGFRDELDGKFKQVQEPNTLLFCAYDLGREDAIAGDDFEIIDYQTNDEILNRIYIRHNDVEKKIKLTPLEKQIIDYMKSMDSWNNPQWGFSAIGYRELSRILNLKAISVSNAMRNLYKKGVFNNCTAKDRWADTTYFLKNETLRK